MSDAQVNHQLGLLNVNWDRVTRMKADLRKIANAQHSMNAQAKLPIISDKAEETGERLCYDAGQDGLDERFWIEDIPFHHVDWDMTEEEWEELRAVLWHGTVPEGSYIARMRRSGALGDRPSEAHVITMHDGFWHCSCGYSWVAFGTPQRCPRALRSEVP
jgi:hypothetical protein